MFLILNGFTQIRYGLRFAPLHIAAIPVSGCYIFIDTIVPLYQFGETKVAELSIGFRTADIDLRNDFFYSAAARGALHQRVIS